MENGYGTLRMVRYYGVMVTYLFLLLKVLQVNNYYIIIHNRIPYCKKKLDVGSWFGDVGKYGDIWLLGSDWHSLRMQKQMRNNIRIIGCRPVHIKWYDFNAWYFKIYAYIIFDENCYYQIIMIFQSRSEEKERV